MSCCGVGVYDLCILQGANYYRIFTWTTFNCPNTGVVGATYEPADITGYTAELQIRTFAPSGALLYDATTNLTLGGTAGTITLNIPASATVNFTWWQGVYDLKLTSPSGFVTRLVEGKVTVSPEVSA